METVHIAVRIADGVAITQFVLDDGHGLKQEATDENIVAVLGKAGLGGNPWRRIDPLNIPEDRTFRGAWVDDGVALHVDMDRAREIHRDSLRALRRPLLQLLDIEQLRAVESNDTAAIKAVGAKKQALRDVTLHAGIAAARTPDELKAAMPAILNGRP